GLAAARALSLNGAVRAGLEEGLFAPRAAASLGGFLDLLDALRAQSRGDGADAGRATAGTAAAGAADRATAEASDAGGADADPEARRDAAAFEGSLDDAFDFEPQPKNAAPILPLVTR